MRRISRIGVFFLFFYAMNSYAFCRNDMDCSVAGPGFSCINNSCVRYDSQCRSDFDCRGFGSQARCVGGSCFRSDERPQCVFSTDCMRGKKCESGRCVWDESEAEKCMNRCVLNEGKPQDVCQKHCYSRHDDPTDPEDPDDGHHEPSGPPWDSQHACKKNEDCKSGICFQWIHETTGYVYGKVCESKQPSKCLIDCVKEDGRTPFCADFCSDG